MIKKNIIFDLHGVLFELSTGEAASYRIFSTLEPGIDLLQQVAQEGHRLFACTNWSSQYIDMLMQEYPELMAYFEGIVTPSVAQARKPDPAIFNYLLATYQLNPAQTIFIDDTLRNVEAALQLSMHGIHLHDHPSVRSELVKLGVLL